MCDRFVGNLVQFVRGEKCGQGGEEAVVCRKAEVAPAVNGDVVEFLSKQSTSIQWKRRGRNSPVPHIDNLLDSGYEYNTNLVVAILNKLDTHKSANVMYGSPCFVISDPSNGMRSA